METATMKIGLGVIKLGFRIPNLSHAYRRTYNMSLLRTNVLQRVSSPLLCSRLHFSAAALDQSGEINIKYEDGLVKMSVPLPSRKERCQFSLRPVTNTLGDFISYMEQEDKGTDRVAIYTLDGERIAKSTSIDILLRQSFYIVINDLKYYAKVPDISHLPAEHASDLSEVKNSIVYLYSALNVEHHQLQHEQNLKAKLEKLQKEIEPMERMRQEMDAKALKRTHYLTWLGLGLMGVQFGFLARLTWWEYSWDIMEPVTYFVGYGTAMACYAYYILTKQEYIMPNVREREHLLTIHRLSKSSSFDVTTYNSLCNAIAQAEYDLSRLRDPLQLNLPIQHIEKKMKDSVLAPDQQ